jgi:hypothetical protein
MIFGNIVGDPISEGELPQGFIESCIMDEVSHLSDEKIQEFCNSEEAEALVEAGVMRKKSLVRLSKKDDFSRRRTMAAFAIAKEKHDPLWDKLVKNRVKERELIGAIVKKYGGKADRVAKAGQKEYLKQKMPLSFMRAGGSDR